MTLYTLAPSLGYSVSGSMQHLITGGWSFDPFTDNFFLMIFGSLCDRICSSLIADYLLDDGLVGN